MALPQLFDTSQALSWRKNGWMLLAGVVVMILGLVIGFWWNQDNQEEALTGGRQLLLQNIELGALEAQADAAALNPAMKPKLFYSFQDRLVLRVTTTAVVMEPVTLSARLLTKDGLVVPLEPSSISLQPGVSSFCCWQLAAEGDFVLQLFRPEKVVTSIPIRVEDVGQVGPVNVF